MCPARWAWFLLLVPSVSTAQTVFHVDADSPCPGSGTPGDPFCTIQAGIGAASDGDEVLVAAGTYTELIDLLGLEITVRGAAGSAGTTIDGSGLGDSVVKCISGENHDTVLRGLTITGGGAIDGGGMRIQDGSAMLFDCVFESNSAGVRGGGLFCGGDCSPTLVDCTFIDNAAGNDGGGMYIPSAASSPLLINGRFLGNRALDGDGGGIASNGSPALVNGLFSGNSAAVASMGNGRGGGMYNAGGPAQLYGCTLSQNAAASEPGGGVHGPATIVNSIVYGNVGGNLAGSDFTVAFSDIGGGFGGDGNIDADPMFVDAAGADGVPGTLDDDLHLLPGSPCIDSGSNAAVSIQLDLDKQPRIMDGDGDDIFVVDMGAYELQPDGAIPATSSLGAITLVALLAATGTVVVVRRRPAR